MIDSSSCARKAWHFRLPFDFGHHCRNNVKRTALRRKKVRIIGASLQHQRKRAIRWGNRTAPAKPSLGGLFFANHILFFPFPFSFPFVFFWSFFFLLFARVSSRLTDNAGSLYSGVFEVPYETKRGYNEQHDEWCILHSAWLWRFV